MQITGGFQMFGYQGGNGYVTGVAPAAKILPVAIPLGDTDSTNPNQDEVPAAIRYAADHGAKIINLSRSYAYQSKGYYASLLAEARGHRIVPTVETMLHSRRFPLSDYRLQTADRAPAPAPA